MMYVRCELYVRSEQYNLVLSIIVPLVQKLYQIQLGKRNVQGAHWGTTDKEKIFSAGAKLN